MKLPLADLGGESEKGVVKALDDLFGPSFREFGQYLGDKVRFQRFKAAERILEKVKDLKPDGVSISPPPVKFLLPFLEDSSLEDPEDDDMCSLWAKLLLSASEECKSEHYLFKRILKEITGTEARLLRALVTESRGEDVRKYTNMGGSFHHEDTPFTFKDKYIEKALSDISAKKIPKKKISRELIKIFEGPGSHIQHVDVSTGKRSEWMSYGIDGDDVSGSITDLYAKYENSFHLLDGLNILNVYRSKEIWYKSLVAEMHVYFMSSMGSEFYNICVGDEV